ncbi:hypothetical protein [Nocardia cyriacigeorgica]|uniref:hypothetical protein n=1 Tax=Nocardia cyriacigeorgica TaxID=135487 RepID=UPI002457621D|nr:hypothetical protein [Nocardia cyriacigeorgica]
MTSTRSRSRSTSTPRTKPHAPTPNTQPAKKIITDPYSPYANATRIPFESSFAGAKVISTDTGVSRVSWSVGPYLLVLEINSDPVIPHLIPRHPFDVLDTLIDTIFQQANAVLADDDW